MTNVGVKQELITCQMAEAALRRGRWSVTSLTFPCRLTLKRYEKSRIVMLGNCGPSACAENATRWGSAVGHRTISLAGGSGLGKYLSSAHRRALV